MQSALGRCFFITLARNFGFGLNGDAFETWANLLSFRAIDKHRDDLTQVEAFFFGQAGLLEGESADDYFSWMQKEFRYLQHKFELPPVMNPSLWRFLRLRPGNFPHVRLAQLASLYYRERSLFSRVMEAETLKDLKHILPVTLLLIGKNISCLANPPHGERKVLVPVQRS